jgi:hypothetical protein
MVPITDGDVQNLKLIKREVLTYEKMSKLTGFSASAISKWMTGDEFELEWRKSVKKKIGQVARTFKPKPAPRKKVEPELVGASVAKIRETVFENENLLDILIKKRDALTIVIEMLKS